MAKKIKYEPKDFMDDDGRVVMTPIGFVRSPLTEDSKDMPFQSFNSEVEGSIEINKEFELGLEGIEGFSHLTIIFYLHKNRKMKLVTVPLLEKDERGIFGTRSPSRPNHIGVSTVRLISREGRILKVKGLDIFDGTPVLDIKPYVPKVDLVRGVDNELLIKKLDSLDKMSLEEREALQNHLRSE